jgi:mRNA-degrading endonuclease RelE of RelBE toxin-antitoxin system
MGYQFAFHPRARKQAEKLPREVDERIRSKIREMVTNEWRDLFDYDVRPVVGADHDIYRTRIGGYRVFFVLSDDKAVILHIDDREGAYGSPGTLEGRSDDVL